MKNLTYLGLLSVPFCLGQHAHAQSSPHPDTQPQQKPNIIFILADDMGYGDLQCYGQQKIETPNIDRLRDAGMQLSQHYTGSPVSAPARCVLLTGLHSGHTQILSLIHI